MRPVRFWARTSRERSRLSAYIGPEVYQLPLHRWETPLRLTRLQRLRLAHVQPAKAPLANQPAGRNHLLMQTVAVAANHHQPGMGNDGRRIQGMVGHLPGRDPVQPFLPPLRRPDLGPQQPQGHLHQPVIEMGQDHIVPPRANWWSKTIGRISPVWGWASPSVAGGPTAAERRQMKDGKAGRSGSGHIPSTSAGRNGGCPASCRAISTRPGHFSGDRRSVWRVSRNCSRWSAIRLLQVALKFKLLAHRPGLGSAIAVSSGRGGPASLLPPERQ
jgi:hypothetical protein